MNAKSVITIALLLFVGACVVALAVNGLNNSGNEAGAQATAEGTSNSPGGNPGTEGSSGTAGQGSGATGGTGQTTATGTHVLALYFHGNIRCPTCRKIEQYAHEAVHSGFADQLRAGTVTWRVINYEQPGNATYLQQYELVAPTLVLVQMDGTREVKYENLMQVWELVGEKQAFFEFVQEHVRAMLGEKADSTEER